MAALVGMSTALPVRSCFAGRRLQSARRTAFTPVRTQAVAGTPEYPNNWLPKDPLVIGASIAGWVIPSNIGVPALGGKSLFGAFVASIGQELSHFPTGPALNDNFWIYMITWHLGLFLVLFFGQIGVQARKQGYLD